MAKVLLFGLEHEVTAELRPVLNQLGQTVQESAPAASVLEHTDANVVFAAGDSLEAVRHTRPELPVVVVTRIPEVRGWLDALDAGASDYCGAPFEATQVRWVLDSSLRAA
jgi:DNA-binding NtrC family response regulator